MTTVTANRIDPITVEVIGSALSSIVEEMGEALMAVVEPQAGVTLEIPGIRARLKAALADYKVPKHIEIRGQLPREDSGKIFKRRLRDPYWERAGRRI